ncbi:type IV secretion system protein [Paraburkholderia gardini]|uniref:type IV secretion system protein n=1 Tax=Paraburkholderia gardini TaxID=2823469 RepID=UPI001D7ABFE1|nr:type IV secretion system protein [Paraburkholderia gardini]CAG4926239.1 hypothetical protein R69919_05388 [Paraburkholderia gardini]
MLKFLKRATVAVLVPLLVGVLSPTTAFADDVPLLMPDGNVMPTGTPIPTAGGNVGATVKAGEIGAGNAKAVDKITALFASIMDTAVTLAAKIKPEADKFASGLAVITIVLAAIRFAATKDPVMAWVAAFEELAILGIFASFYVGYASFAPMFYKWFLSLATTISGSNMSSAGSMIGSAAGQLYDSFAKSFAGASWWQYPALLMAVGPLVMAWAVLSVTSVVFLFFINVGQLQMAAGAVMGQIAFALGFSSFTRGYFKSWLDYMISAGMYVVVAAILMALVTNGLTSAINDSATGTGVSTPLGASYVLDLALFVFMLSFEIPKIAGMFGGGANASGAIVGKVARVASGGLV